MNIYVACEDGNVNELLAAIKRGEDVNEGNVDNWNPLMFASLDSSPGHLIWMRILINHGAIVPVNVTRDNDQFTALQYAAENNNINRIHLLLDNGAEIDQAARYNNTPLMMSFYNTI